jgi:anti-sigma B factor antagonist
MAQEASTLVAAGFPQLGVYVSQGGGATWVELTGELDEATAPSLREQLAELVASLDNDVVLDIEFLSFLDPIGLALFVALHKRVAALGRRVVIYAPTPLARRLFQITGLDQVLTIEPTP